VWSDSQTSSTRASSIWGAEDYSFSSLACCSTSSSFSVEPPSRTWVFPQHAGHEVLADYELGRVLGQGAFGATTLATCRRTALLRACKTIAKQHMCNNSFLEDIRQEVAILQALKGHPGVVELLGVYEDARAVHLVMELCTGGDLLDELTRRGRFSEHEAASIMAQVLRALAHCHARGVVHAPEVMHRSYGPKADVWSAGVAAYTLVSGRLPFFAASDHDVIQAVLYGELDLSSGAWEGVSAECRDFVAAMLTRDPAQRPSAEQLLSHPWLVKHS